MAGWVNGWVAAAALAVVVAGSDGKQADQQRAHLAANAKREDVVSLPSGWLVGYQAHP